MQVQVYYQGNTCIWVPKQKACKLNVGQWQRPKQPNKKNYPKSYTKENQTTLHTWRKKEQVTPSTKVHTVANHKNKESQKSVWVRKDQSSSKPKDPKDQLSKQIKHRPSDEMQLRMANLQVLLFGMASIQRTTIPSATNGNIILVK